MTTSMRMDSQGSHLTGRMLDFTLEIIYLLTGEDYKVVKRTSNIPPSNCPHESSPPSSPILESNKKQKILEVTKKMMELLTGEVPIRCQDVTVYFSMEEWEYLEGHKDLYKDVMMDNQPPLTSPAGKCDVGNSSEGRQISSADYNTGDGGVAEEKLLPRIPHHRADEKILMTPEGLKGFQTVKIISPNQGPRTSERPFPCSECGKSFPWKGHLLTHLKSHIGERPFACLECGKCFIQKGDLLRHQKSHTGERPFPCSECGKCFIQKTDLLRHKRIHTGERPYSCTECGKCFTQKGSLLTHQKSHVGERPFICSECGKCFIQKGDLLRHQKSHSGERPFSCSECGKCFIHKADLLRHQRSHKGKGPFLCSECGKCLMRKADFLTHQRRHMGDCPFSCAECGKSFTRKGDLLTHQRSHPGERPFSC